LLRAPTSQIRPKPIEQRRGGSRIARFSHRPPKWIQLNEHCHNRHFPTDTVDNVHLEPRCPSVLLTWYRAVSQPCGRFFRTRLGGVARSSFRQFLAMESPLRAWIFPGSSTEHAFNTLDHDGLMGKAVKTLMWPFRKLLQKSGLELKGQVSIEIIPASGTGRDRISGCARSLHSA
jgi:hypothetical protein